MRSYEDAVNYTASLKPVGLPEIVSIFKCHRILFSAHFECFSQSKFNENRGIFCQQTWVTCD